jgi:predicted membrane protein (TIGR00267 family)
MTKHKELHKTSSEKVRDFIIGMSDGLTVPFALAAGLSGVVVNTDIIVTAGIAEIAAGSIAMALGGYLAAKTENEHYYAEYQRELYEIDHYPEVESKEVETILLGFGVPKENVSVVLEAIKADKKRWTEFMMRFELGLEEPQNSRMFWSPLIIGLAYIFGGILPLLPYMFHTSVETALHNSVVVTFIALICFGAFKGHLTGINKIKSAVQTLFVGGAAAATAYFIASLFH